MSNTIGRPGTSYYQQDNGVKSDRAANLKADALTAGQGDGRISQDDAKLLAQKLIDGGVYTDAEKESAKLIREGKVFTPGAKEVFEGLIRSFTAKEGWETRRANEAAEKALKAGTEQQALQTGTASMLQTRIDQKS